MSLATPTRQADRLDDSERAELRELGERVGVVEAARAVGMSRTTFATIVAGLPARVGSLLIARSYLARQQTSSPPRAA